MLLQLRIPEARPQRARSRWCHRDHHRLRPLALLEPEVAIRWQDGRHEVPAVPRAHSYQLELEAIGNAIRGDDGPTPLGYGDALGQNWALAALRAAAETPS